MTFDRLLLLALVLLCGADIGAQSPTPVEDYRLQEFPALPAPSWVKVADHGATNPKLAGIRVPDVFKVEVVAEEPVVLNPVSLSFDGDGRAYVIQWTPAKSSRLGEYEIAYQDGTTGRVRRMFKDSRDELRRLDDTNGDGVWDASTVVMNDLEMSSTAVFHDGWWYLPSVGHVLRRRIVKQGEVLTAKQLGPARATRLPAPEAGHEIVEQEIVRGMCGFNQHQASGITVGGDGWLYITSGDDDNKAEGADGSRVTVLRCGVIYRCRPDGSELHEVARGFRNPYRNVVFDPHFNLFHIDNDQEDGSKFTGVRLMHVLDGNDFGWRLYPGAVCCRVDHSRAAVFGERAGKLPSLLKTGRGAPAGLLCYQSKTVEKLDGWLIYPDVVRKSVRAYRTERAGATFNVVEQFELMASDDGLFRPCEAVQGPDGAIYIADWRTNGSGAGNLWGDNKHGRIYRISSADEPKRLSLQADWIAQRKSLTKKTDDELVAALSVHDSLQRRLVAQEITRRFASAGRDAQESNLWQRRVFSKDISDRSLCALVGALCQGHYDAKTQMWLVELATRDTEVGRSAAEVFFRNATIETTQPNVATQIARFQFGLQSSHPEVKRTSALALSKIGQLYGQRDADQSRQLANTLVMALLQNKLRDVRVNDALVRAVERLNEPGIRMLSQHLNQRGSPNKDKALAAFESMRTRAAARVLDGVLFGDLSHLSSDEQRRLISSYRNYQLDPPIPVSTLVAWLVANNDADPQVLLAGLETVAVCIEAGSEPGDPEALQTISLGLLNSTDESVRLTTIEAIGAAGLNALSPTLATALLDAKRSVEERRAIVRTLGRLRSFNLAFLNTKSKPGVESVLDQLATVAQSPEQGHVRGDALSVLSQVDFAKAQPIAHALLVGSDIPAAAAAIDVLGTQPAGAKDIAQRFLDKKLDRALLPRVSAALQRHVEKDATGEFKTFLVAIFKEGLLVDADQTAELVTKTGNAENGKSVYLDKKRTQCANCHKLEGAGGQVGPDLTKTWQTHTVPKLIESLLEPSKEIKENFATWTVTTKKGQVYNGLKISESKREVVLRDAQGLDIRVLTEDIEEQLQSRRSLMPDGLATQLSLQEFVDLIAFLKSREAQAELGRMK